MAFLFTGSKFSARDANGAPLALGKVYTYLAGTLTPQATYTNQGGGTPNANPVILDGSGRASIWLDPTLSYRFITKDSGDVLAADGDIDNIRSPDYLTGQLSASSGSSLVGFLQSGTGAVLRTVQDKSRELSSSVKDFGGVSGADAAAAVALASAASKEVFFSPGAWPAAGTPTITGNSLLRAAAGATFSGAGMAALGFTTGALEQHIQANTTGADFATSYFRRNASHSGGSAGFVSSCVRAETWVSNAAAANYEWAFTSVLHNGATNGQNVAGYLQGNKEGTGATWALVAEAIDSTNVADPTKGLLGAEIDIRANGTDASNNRVGIDVVISRQLSGGVPAGAAMQAGFGVRVQNTGDGANSVVKTGFMLTANAVVGFDSSASTITQAAFKMAQGQALAFNANATRQLSHNGSGWVFNNNGTSAATIVDSGAYWVATNQVVGGRVTGWGAGSNGSRAALNGSTATLAQTSAALAQLIIDLTAHGLIGA